MPNAILLQGFRQVSQWMERLFHQICNTTICNIEIRKYYRIIESLKLEKSSKIIKE